MFPTGREYTTSVQFIFLRSFNFIVKLFLAGLVSTGSISIHVNQPFAAAAFSCGPNEYYIIKTKRCDWCSGCPVGHTIKKQCTRYKNTVCEPCPPGSFSEREGDVCSTCRTCLPGQFVQKECNTSSNRICKACPILTFSDKENSATCRPCKTCRTYETTLAKCTVSSDTACGECRAGYFRMQSLDECWKCSPCYPEHVGLTFVMSECQRKVIDSNMTCMPVRPPYIPDLTQYRLICVACINGGLKNQERTTDRQKVTGKLSHKITLAESETQTDADNDEMAKIFKETMDSDIADRTESRSMAYVENHFLTSFSVTISVTVLLLLTSVTLLVIYMKYRNRLRNRYGSCVVDSVKEYMAENKNQSEKNAQTLNTNCESNDSDSRLTLGYFNFANESNLTSSSNLTKSRKTKRARDERLKERSASTPASIRPLLRASDYLDVATSQIKENDLNNGESKTFNFEKNDIQHGRYFKEDHGLHPGVTVSEVNECSSEADNEEELSVQSHFEDPKLISPHVTQDSLVDLDRFVSMSKEGEICKKKGKKEKRNKKRRHRREKVTNSKRPLVDLSYFSVHTNLS